MANLLSQYSSVFIIYNIAHFPPTLVSISVSVIFSDPLATYTLLLAHFCHLPGTKKFSGNGEALAYQGLVIST